MKDFITYNQSGSLEPNMFDGLLLWLDASESGTLSRVGTKAKKIFDKSDNNHVLVVPSDLVYPSILQSRFMGKTALKFSTQNQRMLTSSGHSQSSFITIGVINGAVHIDYTNVISMTEQSMSVPDAAFEPPLIVAELLVFTKDSLNEYDIEWLIDYLTVKWNLSDVEQDLV